MEIQIGPAPDYCMKQGQVIYLHKINVHIEREGICLRRTSIENRSLLMAAREAIELCEGQIPRFMSLIEDSRFQDHVWIIGSGTLGVRVGIKLLFPTGLSTENIVNLQRKFTIIFKF